MASITETLKSLVDLIEPLSPEERRRVVQGALAFYGDATVSATAVDSSAGRGGTAHADAGSELGFAAKARAWMKQNDVSTELLEQVFHFGPHGHVELIASLPGKSRREQTLAAYILTGLGNFLTKGDGSFDDELARGRCETAGCFDAGNHAKFLKDKGNELSGDKQKGWSLTSPGLKRAAGLVKEMASDASKG